MTPTTAQAIIEHVKRFNVAAKPSVSEAEGVLKTWLRAIGWKQDNWGNFLDPSDPKTRYHFKKTQLNKQWKNDSGDWSNLSYTSSIDSSLSLIVSAAGVVGDQELVAKYSKSKGKRKEEKQTRADTAKEQRDHSQTFRLAMREYGAQRRGFVEKYLLGKASDQEVSKASEEMVPLRVKWLAAVQEGSVPKDDQGFATADSPPVIPVLGRSEDGPMVWTETVDGVKYTVVVNPVGNKTAEISIGDPGSTGLKVSAVTRHMTYSLEDTEGDAYIAGRVSYDNGKYYAALFLIMAGSKQKGAGTRVLSIWCRMMSGYGVKMWAAEAVGAEGAAFMEALEKKGKLKILVKQGPNWGIECTGPAKNPSPAPSISTAQARDVGTTLQVNWKTSEFDVEQFRRGMTVELEHGDRNDITNLTDDNLILTGMVAFAHLLEFPDYYYRLADMEEQADRDKKKPKQKPRVMMKSKAYRDKPGYLIYGTTVDGGSFSVFEKDKAKAEKIRDEYKAGKPGYAYRVDDLLLGRPAPNPPPIELQIAARKMAPKWKQYGVTSVGTGYALALGESKPQWSLFAWTRDLPRSQQNLPKEVDGYPVRVRDVPHALHNPSDKPHWQQMAETRHAREAVLQEIREGIGDRAEIAKRTGLGEVEVALVMRQLERDGEIEYEQNPVADKYKIRKLGEIGGWPVFSVKEGEIRNKHQDFVCGGNHGRYVWLPQPELWVEETKGADATDTAANAYHEAFEYRLMRKGMSYDNAHEKAEAAEKKLRQRFGKAKTKFTLSKALAFASQVFEGN